MIVGYGGDSSGFPLGLSPTPFITTFPQASLRVGLSADPHAPQLSPIYFQGRPVVHRPYVRLVLKPPSAQSPFARSRCYLSRRGCSRYVSATLPPVIAPKRGHILYYDVWVVQYRPWLVHSALNSLARTITSPRAATHANESFVMTRTVRRTWLPWPGWWSASGGVVTPTA